MNGVENLMQSKVKMVELEVSVDEEWPVFSLNQSSHLTKKPIWLTEVFYREYLWTMYKYHEMQLKLKVLYEEHERSETGAS